MATSESRHIRRCICRCSGVRPHPHLPARCTAGPPMVARHCLANGHHSAQPRFKRGFRNRFPQAWHRRTLSVLKNSTELPQAGQVTSNTSPGFQNWVSCPGHFKVTPPGVRPPNRRGPSCGLRAAMVDQRVTGIINNLVPLYQIYRLPSSPFLPSNFVTTRDLCPFGDGFLLQDRADFLQVLLI
jgi:hypothetical protein